jgi:hypothetical protein
MQLITSNLLGEFTLLPINNHINARYQSLVETPDDIKPVFILVEEGDDITGPDYAIISSENGLL